MNTLNILLIGIVTLLVLGLIALAFTLKGMIDAFYKEYEN